MTRNGYPETPYFSFSYTQLRDENGCSRFHAGKLSTHARPT